MFSRKWDAAAVLILIIFLVLLLQISAQKSPIFEENNHLSAGYYFLKTNDYRMGPGHPPLTYKLAALPLLFSNAEFPFENNYCQDFLYYGCAQEFLYNSDLDAGKFIFLGRIPFILLAILTGFFIFKWAKELYGVKAGVLSLLLYALSPTILGWVGLIMTDFSVAAFIFLSVYFLWRLLKNPNIVNLLLTGICFGLALSSKATALLLIHIFIIIIAVWFLSKKPFNFALFKSILPKKLAGRWLRVSYGILSLFAIALISFFVIWAVYGFDTGSFASGAPDRYTTRVYENINFASDSAISNGATFFIEKLTLPFPSYFVGLSEHAFVSVTSTKSIYLLGSPQQGTVWYFHPLEFLLKVPIPFLLLLASSFAMLLLSRKNIGTDVLFLLFPAAAFFLVFVFAINIGGGIQHILPVFPFLFVFVGRIVHAKTHLKWAVILLTVWYVAVSLLAFPHYIGYFNNFVNQGEGYRYFLGANVDSGQDLKGLGNYVSSNNLGPVKLSYFGTSDPKAYLDYEYLPSPYILSWVPGYAPSEKELAENYTEDCGSRQGIIAISVTNLKGRFMLNQTCYSWLESYEPFAVIGHSIFIYNITDTNI